MRAQFERVAIADRQALVTKYHGAEGFIPPSVQEALEHFDVALAHDPAIDADPFIAELQRRAKEVA